MESTIDQKFELAKDWPPSCKKGWDFHNRIGEGHFGRIYVICKDNKCNYVAKVIGVDSNGEKKDMINEVTILQNIYNKTTSNPIVPKVCDSYTCDVPFDGLFGLNTRQLGIIIMERLDGSLKNLLDKNIDNIKLVVEQAFECVRELNRLDILHRDMSIDNIGYQYTGEKYHIKIIDFGHAIRKGEKNNVGPNWTFRYPPESFDENPNYDIECLQLSLDRYYKKRNKK